MNQPSSGRAAPAVAWAGALVFGASLMYFLHAYFVRFGEVTSGGSPWRPAAVNTALFTLFALHHSTFARLGLKRHVQRIAGPLLERTIYTWIASLLFILVCWAWRGVPGELYRLEGAWTWLGYAVQAVGIVLTFLGSRALDVLDLAGVRQARPAGPGHEPPRLITSGAFALVRHPLYLGWALIVFGAPHMTATRLVFAVVSTLYLAVAIPWEERSLVAAFGSDYEAYRRRVRWRMVPWLY